jgi:hypothetical protein
VGVTVPFPFGEIKREQEPPSLTYRLDLDKGRIMGRVDGLAAVEQAIRKHLISPRFRCLIYTNQYGSEIKQNIIASDATPEYIRTELPRLVRDALSIESRVLGIRNFTFELDGERAQIRFEADTVFGQTVISEVI